MAETTKTTPTGPLREPLPPIYPIPLIDVACRALEALSPLKSPEPDTSRAIGEATATALRIIRDGLASHELAAKEGRSRG